MRFLNWMLPKGIMLTEGEGGGEGGGKEEEKKGAKGPLTQEAFDQLYKEMKTATETLDKANIQLGNSEKSNVALVTRIKTLEDKGGEYTPPAGAPPVGGKQAAGGTLRDVYNEKNFPKTEEEWDDLIADFPTYGTDLRKKYLDGSNSRQTRQLASAKRVQEKHPEMFQRNADGSIKMDEKGFPVPDLENAKTKLFIEIAEEDPNILSVATGPELVMASVEQRMGGKKEEDVKADLEKKKREEEERLGRVKAGGTGSGGSGAPPKKEAGSATFNSDAEKDAAETAVASGKYKTLEDYCATRDGREVPYRRGF